MENCKLASLLDGAGVRTVRLAGTSDDTWQQLMIAAVCCDSRQAAPGTLFFGLRGAKFDGTEFVPQAIERGACAVVLEAGAAPLDVAVPVIEVSDARAAFARACAVFYGHPAADLLNIAVTGTNGKTSVAWIAAAALQRICGPTCLVGTLGMSLLAEKGHAVKTINTTPDPLELQRFLAGAPQAKALVMEVTSQGVVQRRTEAVDWDAAAFTNLTRDHLDLHGTLENYEAAKTALFTEALAASSKQSKQAILNLDDPAGRRIREALSKRAAVRCVGFSLISKEAEAFVQEADCSLSGIRMRVAVLGQSAVIQSRLVGRYNVANLLTAAAVLVSLGFPLAEVADAMADVPAVPGRLERVGQGEIHVFVDYAHTPDALVNVQQSLREMCSGRLITVFGCGGDRDRGKRPMMGQTVAELSDYAVATSDNPRTEDPERIIDDIEPGITAALRDSFAWVRITKREDAIAHAIEQARPGDVVLVAGKGHEDYQEIRGVRHPFRDSDVCRSVMRRLCIL